MYIYIYLLQIKLYYLLANHKVYVYVYSFFFYSFEDLIITFIYFSFILNLFFPAVFSKRSTTLVSSSFTTSLTTSLLSSRQCCTAWCRCTPSWCGTTPGPHRGKKSASEDPPTGLLSRLRNSNNNTFIYLCYLR